ncbi:hypothetical protein SAMN02745866_04289 [Alteromonadaceae bacterium Bs31]|nr:hypothetical protein SAMN02745866_04289 [Alteromonadaceae bacterium Bs31]
MRSKRLTSVAHNKALKHQPSKLCLDLRYDASRLHCGRLARRYGSSIMKLLSIIILLTVSACSIVDVEDYIHEPTDGIRHAYIYSRHEEFDKQVSENFVLVPNFRTFSRSYSSPYAKLLILSKSELSVEILSIELTNEDKSVTVSVGEALDISKTRDNTSYFYGSIIVLRADELDTKYWNSQDFFTIKVSYNIDGGKILYREFKLKHDIYKDIAWPT